MSFLTIFKVALRSLGRNPIRSFLSCLGIGIGIVAVILAMAIGEGAKTMMVKEISSMGNNLMMVFPERRNHGPVSGGMGQGQTMTAGDAEAIKRELGHLVQGVSPQVRTTVQMMYGPKNWSGNVQGVATDVLNISNWTVTDGRFFTDDETRLAARVCCIGTTVRSNLFGEDEDPVGKVIRLKNMTFKVIGVLGSKGANNWGQDQDDVIMAPYTSVQRYLQRSKFNNINMMNLSLVTMDDLEEARREVSALLRQRHHLADYQDNDFETRDTTEIMNTIGSVTGIVGTLLLIFSVITARNHPRPVLPRGDGALHRRRRGGGGRRNRRVVRCRRGRGLARTRRAHVRGVRVHNLVGRRTLLRLLPRLACLEAESDRLPPLRIVPSPDRYAKGHIIKP